MTVAPLPSPNLDPNRVVAPDKFVDKFSSFQLDGGSAPQVVRPAEASSERVRAFSNFSQPDVIRSICHSQVPGWSRYREDEIAIDQICAGLTNQLYKVYLSLEGTSDILVVLFRIYGEEVGSLYDTEIELEIFKTLSEYQIAPKIYANGSGWRIEEYHKATPLKTIHMRNPSILTQVASQLGRFHKLPRRLDFPERIRKLEPGSLSRLKLWANNAQLAANRLLHDREGDAATRQALEKMQVERILEEREWLKKFILEDDPQIRGSGLDIVFSHNDCQENNILQTQYGLRFIDFEYSCMDYQAYDISNYFTECTMDYCYDQYPFYSLNLSDYPSVWEQKLFCAIYLSEYLETKIMLDDPAVDRLLKRVQRFSLCGHLLWSLWSIVRAPQAITFNDFDFLHWGQSRWDCYLRHKSDLLEAEKKENAENGNQMTGTETQALQPKEPEPQAVSIFNAVSELLGRHPYLVGSWITSGSMVMGAVVVTAALKFLRR